MTLNITVVSPEMVLQASDRRFVDANTMQLVDDSANKAIVIGCSDALLAITFCGVGTFKSGGAVQRLDWWLAEKMLDAGIPELTTDDAVTFTAEAATKLFCTFSGEEPTIHEFTLAARGDVGAAGTHVWVVSNRAPTVEGERACLDHFEVHSVFSPRRKGLGMVIATGLQSAVSRSIRRRMKRKIQSSRNSYEAELAVVEAIRQAASDPLWSWGIGRDCMVVTLHPGRVARATYYPAESDPHSFGPVIVWNTGTHNAAFADADVLPGGGYPVVFGGGESAVRIAVGQSPMLSGPNRAMSKESPMELRGMFRFSELKHGTPSSDSSRLVSFLSN